MEIVMAVVAAIGLVFAGWQLHEQTRAKRLNLGQFYIQRYWSIDDKLLLAPKGSAEHRRHRHRYLRLFEDEFDAARLRWLDASQWSVWHAYLDDPRQADLIVADLELCDPDEENFALLRSCLRQRRNDGGPHSSKLCPAGPEAGPLRMARLGRRALSLGAPARANG